jgi:cell fate regulator YaaT (PSP1 superfamily)
MSETEKTESLKHESEGEQHFYRIRFRDDGQHSTASYGADHLSVGTVVLVQTDHGLEPAKITRDSPICGCKDAKSKATYVIQRVAQDNEHEKYFNLAESEERAFSSCTSLIKKHKLNMHLVRVERFFNGSKMIFYFTADNRVDFRGLVKDLVQEFRTRVEMRQVGVRHETKMIGGIGTCGRELCCSSFIKKFDSVSIKMAKEQDLPLNPTKISGVCNRLLCCLTYEYDTYKKQRKEMPKPGKRIKIGGDVFLVRRQIVLKNSIVAENSSGEDVVLSAEQWQSFQPVKRQASERKKENNSSDD